MPDWIRRTALADILGTDFTALSDEALYRNLDRLHPQRARIEQALAARERTLFNLDDTIYLYDLTSTYFEGQCPRNPQAKRGYSRDHRPDCKQVVIGLVLDRDGFPKAHEVFDGNRQDRTTVDDMLTRLEAAHGAPGRGDGRRRPRAWPSRRTWPRSGRAAITTSWPARYPERGAHQDAFDDDAGWTEVLRVPSPRNPGQKKTRVVIKRQTVGDEVHILCRSDGAHGEGSGDPRHARAAAAGRSRASSRRGSRRAACATPARSRRRSAGSRSATRGWRATTPSPTTRRRRAVSWTEQAEKKTAASALDGTYLLKTDRQDLTDEEIWRLYILLTRVEAAFRAMKSPLMERPIFHHLEHRVQTHIFLCVLAYHLLVAIEKRCLDQGRHTSWATLREQLSTHQVVTVVLPAIDGRILKIRKASTPDDVHREIYRVLQIPHEVMKPVKTWTTQPIVTQRARNPLKSQHSAPQTVEVGLGPPRATRKDSEMIRAVDIKAELAGRPVLTRARQGHHRSRSQGGVRRTCPVSRRQHLRGELFGRESLGTASEGRRARAHPRRRRHAHHHDGHRASVLRDDGGNADRRAAGPLAPIPRPGWRHGADRNTPAHRPHGRRRPENSRVTSRPKPGPPADRRPPPRPPRDRVAIGAMRSSMSRSKKWRSGGSVENSAWKASRSTASTLTAVTLRTVAVRHMSPSSAISPKHSPGPSRRHRLLALRPGRA